MLSHSWFKSSRKPGSHAIQKRRRRRKTFRPLFETLEDRRLLAVFTVTNTLDSGDGSLRQVLADANATANIDSTGDGIADPDGIEFNIAGSGVQTISPLSALPDILDPVVIDGYTQPGASPNTLAVGNDATLLIELNGAGAGSSVPGLNVRVGNCTIRGLVINRFQGTGIQLANFGDASNSLIEGNYIGTNVAGDAALGNGHGIGGGSSGHQIGGPNPAQRNVISGSHGGYGIAWFDVSNSVVENNYIGVNAAGTAALGNRNTGISIAAGHGATGNRIGGTTAAQRNVISGNGEGGIGLSNAAGNVVQGNYIGVDATGTYSIPNTVSGVGLGGTGATSNLIGGSAAGTGNLISGNNGPGVRIVGASFNTVQGNRIGVQADGVSPLGNTGEGVLLQHLNFGGGERNTIGGAGAADGNTIAFNGGAGIRNLANAGNPFLGNRIFANAVIPGNEANSGLGIDLGFGGVLANDLGDADTGANNGQNYPVLTSVTATNTEITIAGTLNSNPDRPFRIEFFASAVADPSGFGEGERFLGSSEVTTAADGNASFSVTLPVPVSLSEVVTATATDLSLYDHDNNAGTAPISRNDTSEFSEHEVVAVGNTDPTAEDDRYGVNKDRALTVAGPGVLANDSDPDSDPLTAVLVSGPASGALTLNADGSFTYTPNAAFEGTDSFSYQAHDGAADSNVALVILDVRDPLVVTTTADVVDAGDGAISLREAILFANGNPNLDRTGDGHADPDRIEFNIPGSGVQTINSSPMPTITDPVVIDGYTQPGASPNTLAVGNDAVLLIQLTGKPELFAPDLDITAGGSTIRGLVINKPPTGSYFHSIWLRAGGGNTIGGNFIGLDPTGEIPQGGASSGIVIQDSTNNTIGGIEPADRNVISSHHNAGVNISGGGSTGNRVLGNYIGTNAAGTAVLAKKQQYGVSVGGSNNSVGGLTPTPGTGAGNLLSGNDTGVIVGGLGSGNIVQGNLIGADATGTSAVPNQNTGAYLSEGPHTLGGTDPQARNIISGNSSNGVTLANGGSPLIQGNFIGADITGTQALPNANHGIAVNGSRPLIGGTAAGAGNLISGNTNGAISIFFNGTAGQGGATIQGNWIGTDVSGTGPLGNGGGIGMFVGADNLIGGTEPGAGNIIAFNASTGVEVGDSSSVNNRILGNSIFQNGSLGIDLRNSGDANRITDNDPGDEDTGGNNLQNFPELTTVESSASGTRVAGSLDSLADYTYRLEFFSSPAADPSGYGEGQTFLGAIDVTTDTGTVKAFDAVLPGIAPVGHVVTATATRMLVEPNFVAWWPGDGNTDDIIGGHNGTLVNGATYAPGKIGQTFSLDGADDYVHVSDSSSLEVTSQLTLDAWILPNDVSNYRQIISKFGASGSYAYQIGLSPGGALRADLSNNGSHYVSLVSPTGLLTVGEWAHVATTFNAGSWQLYINGVEVASTTSAVTSIFAGGSTSPSIGRDPGGCNTSPA